MNDTMATNLGDAVLTALWEQGWALDRSMGGWVRILRPTGEWVVDGHGTARERLVGVAVAHDSVFDDVMNSAELFVLLDTLQRHGLVWPWPMIPHPRDVGRG